LVPSQHRDLLEVPLSAYEALDPQKWPGVRVHRTEKELFGHKRPVVVTFSESFFTQQAHALAAQMTKCVQKLETLAKDLRAWQEAKKGKIKRPGRPPAKSSLELRVKEILLPQHMKEVIKAEVGQTEEGIPTLTYRSDAAALNALIERVCGKTILFTDREGWSAEEIVEAYRGQAVVEDAFRTMNNWDFLRWEPMHHWTDQKIQVHALYCVVALMLVALIRKKVIEAGLRLSTHELIESLSKIVETVVIYPPAREPAPPRLATTLSHRDPTQVELQRILRLDDWRA
jgi:transposase